MIDMSLIITYLNKIKEKKANMTKEMKQSIKKKQLEIEKPYSACLINNIITKVGNYRIEPPGIFLGRGKHPKSGKIKKRILPKDITINISKGVTIPKPNIGGSWGKVIHDKSAVWLASWKDNISGKNKYTFDIVRENFAWITDKNFEKKMIKTMQKGSRIMVKAYNQKGSQTLDHYSLLGFTKAYKATKANCS